MGLQTGTDANRGPTASAGAGGSQDFRGRWAESSAPARGPNDAPPDPDAPEPEVPSVIGLTDREATVSGPWALLQRLRDEQPWPFALGTACATVGVALLVSHLTWPLIKPSVSFFFAAVVVAAWFAGRASGVVASLLAGVTAEFYLIESDSSADAYETGVRAAFRILILAGCALVIGQLMTARRSAESQLRDANAALERRVRDRTRHLDETNVALRDEARARRYAENEAVAMQGRLREMAAEAELAEERERRRIASGLHDDVAQILVAALSQLRRGETEAGKPNPATPMVEDALRRVRTLTFELIPPILYELGLRAAVSWLVRQFEAKEKISASFLFDGPDVRVGERIEATLFQGLREVLHNVTKHAEATEVCVTMRIGSERVEVDVVDDGRGFDTTSRGWERSDGSGLGLFHVAQRLRHVGGGIELDSGPGRGTRVVLFAPVGRTIPEIAT